MEKRWKVFIKDLIFVIISFVFLVLSIIDFIKNNDNSFFHIKRINKLEKFNLNRENIEEIIKNVEKNDNQSTTNRDEDKEIEEIIKQNKK